MLHGPIDGCKRSAILESLKEYCKSTNFKAISEGEEIIDYTYLNESDIQISLSTTHNKLNYLKVYDSTGEIYEASTFDDLYQFVDKVRNFTFDDENLPDSDNLVSSIEPLAELPKPETASLMYGYLSFLADTLGLVVQQKGGKYNVMFIFKNPIYADTSCPPYELVVEYENQEWVGKIRAWTSVGGAISYNIILPADNKLKTFRDVKDFITDNNIFIMNEEMKFEDEDEDDDIENLRKSARISGKFEQYEDAPAIIENIVKNYMKEDYSNVTTLGAVTTIHLSAKHSISYLMLSGRIKSVALFGKKFFIPGSNQQYIVTYSFHDFFNAVDRFVSLKESFVFDDESEEDDSIESLSTRALPDSFKELPSVSDFIKKIVENTGVLKFDTGAAEKQINDLLKGRYRPVAIILPLNPKEKVNGINLEHVNVDIVLNKDKTDFKVMMMAKYMYLNLDRPIDMDWSFEDETFHSTYTCNTPKELVQNINLIIKKSENLKK